MNELYEHYSEFYQPSGLKSVDEILKLKEEIKHKDDLINEIVTMYTYQQITLIRLRKIESLLLACQESGHDQGDFYGVPTDEWDDLILLMWE